MSKRIAILYPDGSMNVLSTHNIGGRTPLQQAKADLCGDDEKIVTFELVDEAIVPYAAARRK